MKIPHELSRRKFLNFLTLILPAVGVPIASSANENKNINEILEKYGFKETTTGVLFDLETNSIVESHNRNLKLPPASVAKAVTAVYGIEAIGEKYNFLTDLRTDGNINDGTLDGNIYLIGGGDPSLSTDDLSNFVNALNVIGVRKVSGKFFYDSEAIPEFLNIDATQLPEESFNPGFSGLNLNENKVLFSWIKKGTDHMLNLEARSLKTKIPLQSISIIGKIFGDKVFEYILQTNKRTEKWAVLKKILGKKGVRWLPVKLSSTFTSFALHYLLNKKGISVSKPERTKNYKSGLRLLFRHESKSLSSISKEMLHRSTNVTAEVIGLFAANSWGFPTPTIFSSGKMMSDWFNFISKTNGSVFFNHSGLTSKSRVSSLDFVKFLNRKETKEVLTPLLKEQNIYGAYKNEIHEANIRVIAKTGTMHFNRGLAGYITKNGTAQAVFAIFSAESKKKDSVPTHQFANPPGNKKWLKSAKYVENQILANWAKYYM